MERSARDALFDLATREGVQTSYIDINGVEQTASPDRLVQVLRALGVAIETPADAVGLLRREAHTRWSQRLEPVVVAWEGRGSIVLRTPAALADATYRLRVETERGEIVQASGTLERAPVVDEVSIEGQAYVARRIPLPEQLPIGYHTLEVTLGHGDTDSALLLCAPRRVYSPVDGQHGTTEKTSNGRQAIDPNRARTWGLFVPLYALHSQRSAGIGDFTDLRELIDWVGHRGGSVVGTLPLLAAFLDDPCEPSPYAPVSRLAWNEVYLDPSELPEVREGLGASWNAAADRLPRGGDQVDFARVMSEKRKVLETAAKHCFERGGRRLDELEAFRRARPEIDEYARFRAVGERLGHPWTRWPAKIRQGHIEATDFDTHSHRYHLYVQWNVHRQLERLSTRARQTGLGLYLDLPIGVHPHGFDPFRDPAAFVHGLSTGAPPDSLFAGGQNWAFPPLHPVRLRTERYRHIIEVLRNHLRYAGVLRIDHVMGLHRLYVIPDGARATEGVYVRYRAEELYAILSIESHRAKAVLIGENLGTVPPTVQHAMDAHGVHGMHVVQYAVRADADRALPPPSTGEVASLNTHDMPPFSAFWHGRDIDERRDLGWIDDAAACQEHEERRRIRGALRRFLGEEVALAPDAEVTDVMQASLVHLGRSHARLVLVTLEDLWGEMRSQNIPGTYREHPNWCRRLEHAFEAWRELPVVTATLRAIDRARRLPSSPATVRHDLTRITDDDARSFREGTHERIDHILGAHPTVHEGEHGTHFAVWAPAAERVAVIGDWCGWAPDRCPLHRRGDTGIWEGFVPGVLPGDTYKFHVERPGFSSEKADPMAFRAEIPPRSASIVVSLDYTWADEAWMSSRARTLQRPISIYQVHLGSFRRVPEERNRMLGYRELASSLAEHVERLGFTHVQLMAVMEHALEDAWGREPTGYFAPTSRHGAPRDLMYLIDQLHQRGIGVILDWGSTRISGEGHGLARFDGTRLFERTDALRFDLSRPQVRSFLISSACHFLETFHFDGLHVDALDVLLASHDGDDRTVNFLRRLNETLYRRNRGVDTYAEMSAPWTMVSRPTYVGGLGFGLRWDTSWRKEITRYMAGDPIHRHHHHEVLSARDPHGHTENYVLALPHEEAAHPAGSLAQRMPGERWHKLANLRLLYGYMWTQPGKKLLFMGQELAQWQPWRHDHSLDWHLLDDPAHCGVLQWVADLNRLYRGEAALHELDCGSTDSEIPGLEWIEAHDAHHSVLAYLRRARSGESILTVCNFTPVVRHGYRVGIPEGGTWFELLNSDAQIYGGSGVGNCGRVDAIGESTHGRPHTLSLTLPPLSVLVLGRRPR